MNINIDGEILIRKLLEIGFKSGVKFQKENNNSISEKEASNKLETKIVDLFKDISILDLITICKLDLRDESIKTLEQAEVIIENTCPFYGNCPTLDGYYNKCRECIELYFGLMGVIINEEN